MDLLDFITDYKREFVGKMCQVQTNYKELASFKVLFETTDLHHLFGLHKVTREFASQTIRKIEAGSLSISDFKGHKNFKELRQRVALYPFVGQIFLEKSVEYCVIKKDINPNTMRLDIVFFDGDHRTVSVLGLRRAKEGYYKPVTLHQADARKYTRLRKTVIKSIEWL